MKRSEFFKTLGGLIAAGSLAKNSLSQSKGLEDWTAKDPEVASESETKVTIFLNGKPIGELKNATVEWNWPRLRFVDQFKNGHTVSAPYLYSTILRGDLITDKYNKWAEAVSDSFNNSNRSTLSAKMIIKGEIYTGQFVITDLETNQDRTHVTLASSGDITIKRHD